VTGLGPWPRRLARRRVLAFARLLWTSGVKVAWIGETGRRPANIAERALVERWALGEAGGRESPASPGRLRRSGALR
jgi:hypothetical protein